MTERGGGGGGKLKDIKETASDAVEIIREIGTPEVQETLDKIKEIVTVSKGIMETMKTPEWVQNMDNIRMIAENMNNASAKMDNAVSQLKQTGIIDETKQLIKVSKDKVESFNSSDEKGGGIKSQDLHELSSAFKDMLESIRGLVDEVKITVAESKASAGTVHNIKETVKDASDTYKTVKHEIERQ